MKVKIGERYYDSEKEPIMIVLSDKDKENITNMLPECTKFCFYPDDCEGEEIIKWMSKPDKEDCIHAATHQIEEKRFKVINKDTICDCGGRFKIRLHYTCKCGNKRIKVLNNEEEMPLFEPTLINEDKHI